MHDQIKTEGPTPQEPLEHRIDAPLAQPRGLEPHELQAIAGGPIIENEPR